MFGEINLVLSMGIKLEFATATSCPITISLLFIILTAVEGVTAQSAVTTDDEFLSKFVGLTNKSGALTNSYQQEIGKWENNQYSNTTIMVITNDTILQINDLIDETNNLQIPEKFKDGISLYTKSWKRSGTVINCSVTLSRQEILR